MVTRRSMAAYTAASFIACLLFIADYANTYREFYPAMVALANSSAFRLFIVNTAIASVVLLWVVLQFCFFGELNASEETALLSSFALYLVECIVIPLYVDQPIISGASFFFLFTLVWRVLHKLGAERVTTLSTTPLNWVSASRMTAYLCFALICDVFLLTWMMATRPELTGEKASVHYSIILIYVLLLSSTLRSTAHFASLFCLNVQHTLLPFVADAVTSIAESLLFVGVYSYIFYKAALPLLLLRGFVTHVLLIFEKTSALVEFLVLTRRVRNSMPDATAEDLARDGRCTICYEDMDPGSGTKRLPCGHCYHMYCLERWLEGHSTCPYCRANILRMPRAGTDGGTAAAGAAAEPISPAETPQESTAEAPGRLLPPPHETDVASQVQAAAVATTELARREEDACITQPPLPSPTLLEADIVEAYARYRQGLGVAAPAAADVGRPAFSTAPPLHDRTTGFPKVASASSASTVERATLPSVTELKLRAFQVYRRRQREAELELQVALRAAEMMGGAP